MSSSHLWALNWEDSENTEFGWSLSIPNAYSFVWNTTRRCQAFLVVCVAAAKQLGCGISVLKSADGGISVQFCFCYTRARISRTQ